MEAERDGRQTAGLFANGVTTGVGGKPLVQDQQRGEGVAVEKAHVFHVEDAQVRESDHVWIAEKRMVLVVEFAVDSREIEEDKKRKKRHKKKRNERTLWHTPETHSQKKKGGMKQ